MSTGKIVARVKPTEKLESDDKTVPLSRLRKPTIAAAEKVQKKQTGAMT